MSSFVPNLGLPVLARPHYGLTQVRTLEGLKPWSVYKIRSHLGGSERRVLVLSEPVKDSKDVWSVEIMYWPITPGQHSRTWKKNCHDMSLIPNINGTWSTTASIHRIGKKLSTSEIFNLF
jgi:hypothetical protein